MTSKLRKELETREKRLLLVMFMGLIVVFIFIGWNTAKIERMEKELAKSPECINVDYWYNHGKGISFDDVDKDVLNKTIDYFKQEIDSHKRHRK